MNFTRLTALMPCRSLEDLALVRDSRTGEQILAAWTALWHPALVAAARAMPHWAAAQAPPEQPTGHLVLVPPAAEDLLPAGWLAEAEESGAVLLGNLRNRDEMVAAALGRLEGAAPAVDPELAADFLALGFCHFTIEMLTLQMRYMTSLDEPSFERELVAAAEAACRGDVPAARTKLQAAFDLLHSAREYFYPSEAHLLDLTLVASTTLGAAFRDALGNRLLAESAQSSREALTPGPSPGGRGEPAPPANVLISGQVLEEMASREPASLEMLRRALEAGTAALVGGEFQEFELPLLPLEAIRYQLVKGLAACQRRLGRRPLVFGRRRFGMTPALPQILDRLGFSGAMHATLDDGRFPADGSSRIRWQGLDGTTLETLLRVPCDICRPEAFLRLSQDLAGTADSDHVAVAIFAHWPGRSSPWYRDIQRIARYTSVLGAFTTVTDYFERAGYLGQQAEYKADEYRSPYLRQAVRGQPEGARRDPISRWVRYYSRRATAEAIQSLATLERLTLDPGGTRPSGSAHPTISPLPPGEAPASGYPGVRGPSTTVPSALDEIDDSLATESADNPALDDRLREDLHRAMLGFCRSVSRPADAEPAGVLVANPWSFPQRLCLDLPELAAAPAAAEPVQWSGDWAGRKTVVVDVPSMGFAWIGPETGGRASTPAPRRWGLFGRRPAAPPPLAELVAEAPTRGRVRAAPADGAGGAVLRNEFFEIHIDPHTGAIRGVFDYQTRGPRLAQQIALRLPSPSSDADDAYSIMAAEDVAVASPGPVLGEAVVRGRLVNREGRRVAGFLQTTRIWRGSRIIELEIELEAEEPLGDDPWNSYYAARFAWSDDSASLYRGVNQAVLPTNAVELESPQLLDIRSEKVRTTLLCGGLPYHRRRAARKLDTLLVVRGETARRFRLGIGIDLPQPLAAATAFLAPRCVEPGRARPAHASGWLFHLEAPGVLATHWEPLVEGSPRTASGGRCEPRAAGFRVRLLETDGRRIALGLRSFRSIASAQKIGRPDAPPTELPIQGDRITVDLGPHEWAEVEARF
jgi:alpha-mannosidase